MGLALHFTEVLFNFSFIETLNWRMPLSFSISQSSMLRAPLSCSNWSDLTGFLNLEDLGWKRCSCHFCSVGNDYTLFYIGPAQALHTSLYCESTRSGWPCLQAGLGRYFPIHKAPKTRPMIERWPNYRYFYSFTRSFSRSLVCMDSDNRWTPWRRTQLWRLCITKWLDKHLPY